MVPAVSPVISAEVSELVKVVVEYVDHEPPEGWYRSW